MMYVAAQTLVFRPIVSFAHAHDSIRGFRIWFMVSTVLASIIFNLGVFAILVTLHMGLDVIKYRTLHSCSWRLTIREALRESLVDIFFIALGLFLAVTFHHVVAIGGFGRMVELEAFALTFLVRIAPRIKIAEHIVEIIVYWKHYYSSHQLFPLSPLSRGEQTVALSVAGLIAAILLVPVVSAVTWSNLAQIVSYELTPHIGFTAVHAF